MTLELDCIHTTELLAVLTTAILAIVQYFDTENQTKIKELKLSIANKKLPEMHDHSPQREKIRKSWDNLIGEDKFCKADWLIVCLLIFLATLVIFTMAYIFSITCNQDISTLSKWYLSIFSFLLSLASIASVIWWFFMKHNRNEYIRKITAFTDMQAVYEFETTHKDI